MSYTFLKYKDFIRNNEQEDNFITINEEEFFYALEKRDLDTIKIYVKEGCDLNVTNGEGECALHLCANLTRMNRIANFLLDQDGLDVNIQDDNGNYTPLMTYLEREESRFDIVKRIINYDKFNANAKTIADETALHLSIRYSDVPVEIIQLLIDRGADIEVQENFKSGGYGKYTPLMLAINDIDESNTNFEKFDCLIKNGADLDSPLKNIDGKTARDMIKEKNEIFLARKLDKQGSMNKVTKNSGIF